MQNLFGGKIIETDRCGLVSAPFKFYLKTIELVGSDYSYWYKSAGLHVIISKQTLNKKYEYFFYMG